MTYPQRQPNGEGATHAKHEFAVPDANHGRGGALTAVISVLALVFSGYSFWDSSLKGPDLKIFVPPVIQYSDPYNNSNFEVIEVPITLVNNGGRTGTVLSMQLEATSEKSKETKRFYAANFGRWSMEKTRSLSYEPFAPIPLAGKSSRTETVQFYTNGPSEKPDQLIREPGVYKFHLVLDEAQVDDFGVLDRLLSRKPDELTFSMELREYDARAFENGTLPLYSTTGRSAKSGGDPVPTPAP
jgi:hypothetical protein